MVSQALIFSEALVGVALRCMAWHIRVKSALEPELLFLLVRILC